LAKLIPNFFLVRNRIARIFPGATYQHGGNVYQMPTKYTKCQQNIPNDRQIYQIAIKYSKWLLNLPSFTIPRPSKIDIN
jgi:hypothetical protein